MSTLRLAIVGAAGRMGTSLLQNIADTPDLEVAAAVVRPKDLVLDALGPQQITPTTTLSTDEVDLVIDFSTPSACLEVASICARSKTPLVSGTTGLSPKELQELTKLSENFALLHAANFSVGVNLLARLVEEASRAFGDTADIELFEAHHRHKVDAPSGTALLLGEAAARGRNLRLHDVAAWSRQGHTGPRADDEIGFQVLRGGDIAGEHTVYFCAAGERLELTHRATDRGIFARGALRAARWLVHQKPGAYSMADMLFGE